MILFVSPFPQNSDDLYDPIVSNIDCDPDRDPNNRPIKKRDTTGSSVDPTNQNPASFPDDSTTQNSINVLDGSMNQESPLGLKNSHPPFVIEFTNHKLFLLKRQATSTPLFHSTTSHRITRAPPRTLSHPQPTKPSSPTTHSIPALSPAHPDVLMTRITPAV